MKSQFERIAWLRKSLDRTRAPGVAVGNGDDAAVLSVPGQLVVTADALVEGIDFATFAPWDAVGAKALAVNLSDLAAMGADPLGFLLTLCVPPQWPESAWNAFRFGLAAASMRHATPCLGGDLSSTPGPLAIAITALGTIPMGQSLTRDAAQPGDAIYVSGALGGAALGLARLLGRSRRPRSLTSALKQHPRGALRMAVARQLNPVPQLALGRALRGVAHACVDLSDGLVQDLSHILCASGVGAEMRLDGVPMHPAVMARGQDGVHLALTGGEDFELCFTVPARQEPNLPRRRGRLTRIGTVTRAPGLTLHAQGSTRKLSRSDVEALHRGTPRAWLRDLRGFVHF